MSTWTTLKLIEWTSDYFQKNGIPNPRLDAELLLSHILNKKRIDLYLAFDQTVSETDLATFKGYIQRRVKREPLQYITGVQEFWGLPIKVTPDVLIPRPETELLVEYTLKNLPPTQSLPLEGGGKREGVITILDLCTGSGFIISALASELTNAQFVGTDISEKALEIAKFNTEKWKERVELLHGDLFKLLSPPPKPSHLEAEGQGEGAFDLIVSNPPYVPESQIMILQPEIKDYEPKIALVAEDNGLAIIRKIVNDAPKYLRKDGRLVMEIGDGQAEEVKKIIADNGSYGKIEIIKDYGGIERIIITNFKS